MLMNKYACLLIILALSSALPAAAKVYKWQDDDGRWHFTDEPRPGAVTVELPQIQSFEPPKTPPPSRSQQDEQPKRNEATLSYSRVEIISPGPEDTVREASGDVGVVIALEPSLRPGHTVRLLLDGEPAAGPASSTAFTLNHLDRGQHSISAEILNADGRTISRTKPQTFYLHRPSLLSRPAR